jgi:ABC-type multidrug transport system fused ATPase/permease subunit
MTAKVFITGGSGLLALNLALAIWQRHTVTLIAHRLTTVRACDTIFELEDGRVVAQGSYDELLANSPGFRQMDATVVQVQ